MVRNLPVDAEIGLIPGWGRSPGEGNDNPLQCSCQENPMDRGAWQATVQGEVPKSRTRQSMHECKSTLKFIWDLKGLKTILTKKNKLEDSNLLISKLTAKVQ